MLLNWLQFHAQSAPKTDPIPQETPVPIPAESINPETVILTNLSEATPKTLSELYDALKVVQLSVNYTVLQQMMSSLIAKGQVRRDALENGVIVYFKTAKSRVS